MLIRTDESHFLSEIGPAKDLFRKNYSSLIIPLQFVCDRKCFVRELELLLIRC